MKVVLFCGGLGMRMGEREDRLPKPMITIGDRPILWHIMKYYATFGFTDFILCLGYGAQAIKEYFLNYKEELTNDFVLEDGGRRIELLSRDIHEWSITFVSTGLQSPIGQRLKKIEPYIGDDEFFLANYSDVVTDAPLPDMVETLARSDKTALFLASHPTYTFHLVSLDEENRVQTMEDVTKSGIWINAGYFVFRRDIFDLIQEGEDLVEEPFHRLIEQGKLIAYPYDGFWAPMDTMKDRTILENLLESGNAPWRPNELRQRFPAAGAA